MHYPKSRKEKNRDNGNTFEELPPIDRRADQLYLEKVNEATIYAGLFAKEYGPEDAGGVSPTEREFDRATERGIQRLIFVKGSADEGRHPKMAALVQKATGQLIRRRFDTVEEFLRLLRESLVEYLKEQGAIHIEPLLDAPCANATPADISDEKISWFVRTARAAGRLPEFAGHDSMDVLTHLNLCELRRVLCSALLLFGHDPQRFMPAAEIRCMHFHGPEVTRPAPSQQVYGGTLFEQVSHATDFVLSKIARRVGTRDAGPQAPVSYEVPPAVITEAIVNAVAHRDYTAGGAVQVSVFSDRIEVWNPGRLPPQLTPERLRLPHRSIPHNPRLVNALFRAKYMEEYGTGTVMMISESRSAGLPEPEFAQRGGDFVVVLWRDWLTTEFVERLGLSVRQREAVVFAKQKGRITNADYQRLTGASRRTASRDLEDLVSREVFERRGEEGRGVHYVPRRKWARNEPNEPPPGSTPGNGPEMSQIGQKMKTDRGTEKKPQRSPGPLDERPSGKKTETKTPKGTPPRSSAQTKKGGKKR